MSDACDPCLGRAALIGALSPSIEGALEGRPGARARELLALPDDRLADAVGGTERRRPRPAEIRAEIADAGCWSICRHCAEYPPPLEDLGDAPAVLFGRGDRGLLGAACERPVATIVGARRASAYGREVATALGRDLAAAGLVVVSGMAVGIDSCAHEGALAARGATIAVLGGGPDRPSPAGRARLYGRIVGEGLVLSELPPGTTPRRWSFPARNRIMAALSDLTIVVEGRERSGSLITAEMATDLGREVGAVPGRVGSAQAGGPNRLLREGAQVIRGAEDALDSLSDAIGGPAAALPAAPRLEPALAAVLEQVELGAETAGAVALACGIAVGEAAATLVRLEVRGALRSDSGGRYRPAASRERTPG